MDQANALSVAADGTDLGGKSWTAYVPVVLLAVLLLLVATPLSWAASPGFGALVLVVSLVLIAYKVLVIKSYRLYFDDVGIWVFSGVLPWKKGIAGVKWRDLDEAVFFQSLWSWIFKSYSIRIGHRFTKDSEVFLSHWARGHEVVSTINHQHEKLVRADALR